MACTPNSSVPCDCVGGGMGERFCDSTGSGYSQCKCGSTGGSGGIGGGGDASTMQCQPNTVFECKCPAGGIGQQQCDPTGMPVGACDCVTPDGGAGGTGGGTMCSPMSGPFPCGCPDKSTGQQYCDGSGTGFTACECPVGDAGAGGPSGGMICSPLSGPFPCKCNNPTDPTAMGQQYCNANGDGFDACTGCPSTGAVTTTD
jgi:hypothetical protein